MKFSEVIERASDLLQRKGRLSYRTLKLEFDLNEEQLEALKEELIDVQELAVDKDGKMLVWRGDSSTGSAPSEARGSSAPEIQDLSPLRIRQLHELLRLLGGVRETPFRKHERIQFDPEGVIVKPLSFPVSTHLSDAERCGSAAAERS